MIFNFLFLPFLFRVSGWSHYTWMHVAPQLAILDPVQVPVMVAKQFVHNVNVLCNDSNGVF